MASANTIAAGIAVTGAYLAWFGVHYWRTDVTWPSDPVKAVLTGKPLPDAVKAQDLLTTSITAPGLTAGQEAAAAVGATPNGGSFDKSALTALWTKNGGAPGAANTAAAVALAESSGRPGVTSPNPDGGTNVGLWQLDTKGVGAGYSTAQLADPDTNARVTIIGSLNGANWSPWQTYVEGTYKKFL